MPRISCSVGSCSYNQSGICDAKVLKIIGDRANITEQTCCSTYTSRDKMNDAIENETERGMTEEIRCEVETCAYHKADHCSLREGIEVSNIKEVESYRDTDCLSFERKSY